MAFLADKKILIAGMVSNRSIAYGIAGAMRREGAELAFTYQSEKLKERVTKLATDFQSQAVFPCDVGNDAEISKLFEDLKKIWPHLDGLVHSIAYVPQAALDGDYLQSVTREFFQTAHDISSYSFAALAKAALPMLEGRDAALLTLTYLGAERTLPNYNVMGLAKASLEANVRYMAQSLGSKGIRVNGISAGPIKTLAAAGISDFGKILHYVARNSPLKRNVSLEDVGNAAAFLCSALAGGITGEIMHVDAGFNITAVPQDFA